MVLEGGRYNTETMESYEVAASDCWGYFWSFKMLICWFKEINSLCLLLIPFVQCVFVWGSGK